MSDISTSPDQYLLRAKAWIGRLKIVSIYIAVLEWIRLLWATESYFWKLLPISQWNSTWVFGLQSQQYEQYPKICQVSHVGGVIFYFSGVLLNLNCFRSQEEEYQCNKVIQLPAWSNVSNEMTETDAGPKVKVVNYVVNEDGDYLFAIMVKKEDQNTQDFEADIKVEFKSKSK